MRLIAELTLLILAAAVLLSTLFLEWKRWRTVNGLTKSTEKALQEFLSQTESQQQSGASKPEVAQAPTHAMGQVLLDLRAEVSNAISRAWSETARAFLIAGLLVAMSGTLALFGPLVHAKSLGRALRVDIRWSTEERTGDANGNGIPDWEDPAAIDPSSWRVFFAAAGWDCPHSRVIRWEIDGEPGPTKVCRFHHDFATLGRHDVRLFAISAAGEVGSYRGDIDIQDFLIASIGDSVASGEGNPPWTDKRCHRSNAAGPVVAAMKLMRHDDHTTVSLEHLACSGAAILKGLLRPQFPGVISQLEWLGDLSRKRPITAVLISIGANDIGFAKIAFACAIHPRCDTRRDVLKEVQLLQRLPHWFRRLNICLSGSPSTRPCFTFTGRSPLQPLGISPDRVFITEYFDPTRDDSGITCRRILSKWPFGIDRRELEWTQRSVIGPLNQEVATAAAEYRWHFVGGIAGEFKDHGYCAKDTWIVHLIGSLAKLNKRGILHPNGPGQEKGYAQALFTELEQFLFSKGG
jgi:hypothetical protein